MSTTTFYVYHSASAPETPLEPEIQTLLPALDAEQAGAAIVVEIDPNTQPVLSQHVEVVSFPAVVASRNGRPLVTLNPTTPAELDPPTLLNPGGTIADDTLDGLETADAVVEAEEEARAEREVQGSSGITSCASALLAGDVFTPDDERACLVNISRAVSGQRPTNAGKYLAESEIDLFANDTQGVSEDGTGEASGTDDIAWGDLPVGEGFVRKAGERSLVLHKSNLQATVAPVATDDDTKGYSVGSRWIDGTAGVEYVAQDVSTGAAVWIALGAPGGGEANILASVGAGASLQALKTGVTLNVRSLTTPGDKLSAVVNGDEVELGIGSDFNLDDLADVNIINPKTGECLCLIECPAGSGIFEWRNVPGGGGGGGSFTTLGDLMDVTLSGLADCDFLKYDAGSGDWLNVTPAAVAAALDHGLLSGLTTGDPHTQYQLKSEKGAANGYASLDGGGKIPAAQIPAVALPEVHVVADATARLALTVQEGDEAIQLDDGSHWIYDGTSWHLRPSESTTASNVNAGGVGVFKTLNGNDLEFRGINAASAKVTVALDAGNNEIDIDVDPGQIDVGDLSGTPLPQTFIAEATSTITRTLATYAVVPGMTITPGAGTYLAHFSSHASVDKNSRKGLFAIFSNGSLVSASVRRIGGQADNEQGFSCVARVTVGAGEAIDARWRLDATTASPVLTAGSRTLVLTKVA